MLCDKCKKNEAVVFYREVINSKERSMKLCSSCAAEAEKAGEIGKTDPADIFNNKGYFSEMDSLFGGLFGLPSYHKYKAVETKKCSLCGSTFNELVQRGKVGCSECYKVFAEELSGTVAKLHGAANHCGRTPKKFRAGYERKARIRELEEELRSAVEKEEYERAAELRDDLRGLREDEGK